MTNFKMSFRSKKVTGGLQIYISLPVIDKKSMGKWCRNVIDIISGVGFEYKLRQLCYLFTKNGLGEKQRSRNNRTNNHFWTLNSKTESFETRTISLYKSKSIIVPMEVNNLCGILHRFQELTTTLVSVIQLGTYATLSWIFVQSLCKPFCVKIIFTHVLYYVQPS